jgi:hypothetical protein
MQWLTFAARCKELFEQAISLAANVTPNEGSTLNPIRATARNLQAPLPLVADVKMRANGAHLMPKDSNELWFFKAHHAGAMMANAPVKTFGFQRRRGWYRATV